MGLWFPPLALEKGAMRSLSRTGVGLASFGLVFADVLLLLSL